MDSESPGNSCEILTSNVHIYCKFSSKLNMYIICPPVVGLGGLGVTCSPRDPRFAGSNPAEIDGYFQDVKILSKVLREGL